MVSCLSLSFPIFLFCTTLSFAYFLAILQSSLLHKTHTQNVADDDDDNDLEQRLLKIYNYALLLISVYVYIAWLRLLSIIY